MKELFFRYNIKKLDQIAGAKKIYVERISLFVVDMLHVDKIINRRMLAEREDASEVHTLADATGILMDVTHGIILADYTCCAHSFTIYSVSASFHGRR